jgi:uncharacterized protein YciI
MHIVIVKYRKALDAVDQHIAEHRAWLDTLFARGVLLASGPLVPRTGGLLLASGTRSREELDSILLDDPFRNHLIAEYEVITFTPTKRSACYSDLDAG